MEYLNENEFNCYSRPNFVSSVDKELLKVKYKLLLNQENLRIYNNKNKIHQYQMIIINCQNLIVTGYIDNSLIDKIENKLNLIDFDKTSFDVKDTPENKNIGINFVNL